MNDPFVFWAAAIVGSFFVGASKGGLPAVALLSVPLLSLVMPPMQGAALLLPVYLISDVYGLWIYRRSFSLRNLAILFPAGLIGILLGWLLAGQTDDDAVRLAVGLVGLGFIGLRLKARLQRPVPPRPSDVPRGLLWGALTGFTSFVAHAGGPAFQIYVLPQHLPKLAFAGTSTILFALLNLSKLPPYLALGLFNPGDARIVAWLAPVAICGVWVGYRLTRILPERIFFVLIEVTLFLISLVLIREGLSA